jgi:hypothetical protein
MRVFTSDAVATKENKWQRFNVWRFRNEEYDRLYGRRRRRWTRSSAPPSSSG